MPDLIITCYKLTLNVSSYLQEYIQYPYNKLLKKKQEVVKIQCISWNGKYKFLNNFFVTRLLLLNDHLIRAAS